MPNTLIIDAVRTPVGRFAGGLAAMGLDDSPRHVQSEVDPFVKTANR